MKRIFAAIIIALFMATSAYSAGPPVFAIKQPATDPRIGTLTNTKWCYSDGTQVLCTQDAPAGAGDFLANATVPLTGAIIPDSAGGQTIGTTSAEFGHIYLHNSKSIYFQADQSLYLTGGAGALSLTGGNFTPGAATLTLGSTAAEWGGLYLGDGKIIYGQADQSNTITSSATGWTFNLPITTQSAKLTGGTNTFNITNGTASLDVAAGATLNIDTSLQVAAGAVVLNGNAGGSSSLTLGNFALSLGGTMTNGRLCTYTAAGTVIACDTATTTFQAADADLTTWAGITPSANMQTWLASADLAAMKAGLSVDDLVTLSGVADGAVNLGEFTGSTITDNQTVKASLQLLETATEARLPLAGGTMTGVLVGTTPAAGASGYASFRFPHGAAPTNNLTDGDCWTTTAGLFCHINGSTVGPYASSAGTGYATLQEEGSNLTQRTLLNFAGAGFTAADDGANSRTNLTLDADLNTIAGLTVAQGKVIIGSASPAWSVSDFSMAGGTNTFSISNGTASLDVAAGATLDVNANATINTALTVQTGAVTLTGNASGSTLTLPASTLSLAGTMTDGRICTYTSSGTVISCNTATSTFQTADTELTAIAGLTFADASIIQLTGAGAAAVLTSGGNNYVLKATSDNSALEFAAPTGTGAPVLGTAPSFTTSITPNTAGASTIGTTALEWGNVYLTDSAVIYGQADQSATLTSSASTWTASAFTVTGTLTANGNTVMGNADTDTLTLRSLIVGGNSRAVWIAGSAPTPTYATGTNELYVAGDVESGGNVYAANFVSTGTGESYLSLANNASRSPTASAYEIYFEGASDLKFNVNGAEKTAARLEDAQTFTGAKTFSDALTLNRGATGAGQLIIAEDSDDGTNTVTITAQAMAASYTLTLPTTDGDSGQFLQTNGSGSLTWAAPTAAAAGSDTQVQFNDGGSALGGDAGFVFAKTTGTLTIGKNTVGGEVILYNELGATDYNATIQPNAAQAAAATITLPAATGTLIAEGLATGGIVLGDSTPDADGEIGYASNAYKLFANSEDLVLTASTNLWTFSSATSATVAFTPSVALNGGASVGGTLALAANNLTMTGSLAATGARVTKGWFTDVESTNMPTVGGTAILSSLTAPVFATSIEAPFIVLGSAATAADAGTIRMPNAGSIQFEADAAGTDVNALSVDSSEIIQIGSAGASGVTITPATTVTGALTVGETNGLLIGATGVKITSDNDGAITFTGNSAGYDEDLTINLDDTENTAVFSSSTGVTKLDFSALNLATTGIITGAMNTNSDANGMSAAEMTTAGMYGTMFWATGAGTWALPGAATGMNFCVYSTTAAAIVINPDDGDTIVLNGTALSAGDSITSASGAGDFICLLAKDANTWYTLGRSGAWTDTN